MSLTIWISVLKYLIVTHLVKKVDVLFIKPEDFLWGSQEPVSGIYPDSDETRPHYIQYSF
jgi:hypothetical protein